MKHVPLFIDVEQAAQPLGQTYGIGGGRNSHDRDLSVENINRILPWHPVSFAKFMIFLLCHSDRNGIFRKLTPSLNEKIEYLHFLKIPFRSEWERTKIPFMDNCFSTFSLFRDLHDRNCRATGNIRFQRCRHVPLGNESHFTVRGDIQSMKW
jgi:hypothetical protein